MIRKGRRATVKTTKTPNSDWIRQEIQKEVERQLKEKMAEETTEKTTPRPTNFLFPASLEEAEALRDEMKKRRSRSGDPLFGSFEPYFIDEIRQKKKEEQEKK